MTKRKLKKIIASVETFRIEALLLDKKGMAKLLGVSRQSYHNWVTGKYLITEEQYAKVEEAIQRLIKLVRAGFPKGDKYKKYLALTNSDQKVKAITGFLDKMPK